MNVICCAAHISAAVISNRCTNEINDSAPLNWLLCMDICAGPKICSTKSTWDERVLFGICGRHSCVYVICLSNSFIYFIFCFLRCEKCDREKLANWWEAHSRPRWRNTEILWCVVILFRHSSSCVWCVMCVSNVRGCELKLAPLAMWAVSWTGSPNEKCLPNTWATNFFHSFEQLQQRRN